MFFENKYLLWSSICCFSGFFEWLQLTKLRSDEKIRAIFEHSRFIFAAMLSVVRNAIKVFQFVMNKDWLLFFYPGQNFYSSFYSYSKPNLCLTVQKNGIKRWIFSHAETAEHPNHLLNANKCTRGEKKESKRVRGKIGSGQQKSRLMCMLQRKTLYILQLKPQENLASR